MFKELQTNIQKATAFQKATVARLESLVKQGDLITAGAMLYEAVPLFKAYEAGLNRYMEPLRSIPDFPNGFFKQVGWALANVGKIAAFLSQPDYLGSARSQAERFVSRYGVVDDTGKTLEV